MYGTYGFTKEETSASFASLPEFDGRTYSAGVETLMLARNACWRVAARLLAALPAGAHRSDPRLDAVDAFHRCFYPAPKSDPTLMPS